MTTPGGAQGLLYLCLSQVAESEVESPEVVENLRRNVGLHLLPQDAGGGAICRECSLDVSLFQNLSQLDPGLHIIRVLFCYLLQMTLWTKENGDCRHLEGPIAKFK